MSRRRVISLPKLIPLNDVDLNRLTHDRIRNHVHFHYESNNPFILASVNGFMGRGCAETYSDVVILGSHCHLDFFQIYQRHTHALHNTNTNSFAQLKLSDINQCITALKRGDCTSLCNKIRAEIKVDTLPDRFVTSCLPMDKPCLVLMDSRLIKCIVNDHSNVKMVRWKTVFKCVLDDNVVKNDYIEHSMISTAARNHERIVGEHKDSTWPLPIRPSPDNNSMLSQVIKKRLARDGVVVLPICPQKMFHYMKIMSNYLHHIMAWPAETNLLCIDTMRACRHEITIPAPLTLDHLYRNKDQKQSKHIPLLNGKTRYGHYCHELVQIANDIAPILQTIDVKYITTTEIIVQV